MKIITIITRGVGAALLTLGLSGCFSADDSAVSPTIVTPVTFLSEAAALTGEIPLGWTEAESKSPGIFFHHPEAPGHVLSIQKLTENIGSRPLKALKKAFKEHPYFTNFIYENMWATPIEQTWTPAYQASYLYLDAPSIRHGHLVATGDGFYEVAYHAPGQLHPEGLDGYERLVASISIISHD